LTLVELLLAIAIMGVIIGVVAATFHTAVTSWRTSANVADTGHYAAAASEQIYMALRSAYYPESNSPLDKYGFSHTDDGDPPNSRDSFSWVKIGDALIGEDSPYAGVPHRVVLEVLDKSAPQGPGLYVRSWRLDGQPEDFDPDVDVAPLLLSSAVIGLNCQMQDPDASPMTHSDPIEWLDEWEPTNRVPQAVRFALVMAPSGPKAEPLVVERFADIPMAEMSWNPTVTGSDNQRGGRGSRRGSQTGQAGQGNRVITGEGIRTDSGGNQPGGSRVRPGTGGTSSGSNRPGNGGTSSRGDGFQGGGQQPQRQVPTGRGQGGNTRSGQLPQSGGNSGRGR